MTVYFGILIYFLYWKQIFKCWGMLFKFRETDTEVLRERSAATSQMTISVREWHKTNVEGPVCILIDIISFTLSL